MKTINIIGLAVLGWIFVANTEQAKPPTRQNTVYVYAPEEAEGCGCNACDNCSCVKSKTCAARKEAAVDDTAVNFPRPRNPCPGGPGRR